MKQNSPNRCCLVTRISQSYLSTLWLEKHESFFFASQYGAKRKKAGFWFTAQSRAVLSGNGPATLPSPVKRKAIPPPVCIGLSGVVILLKMRFSCCFMEMATVNGFRELWITQWNRWNISGKTTLSPGQCIYLPEVSRELEHVVNRRSTGKWFFTHRGRKEHNFQSKLTPP